MKIGARDVGLLAVGIIVGAVVAVSLTSTPIRPPAAPALGTVVTGPVLAAASLPPRFITTTNIQWQASPIHIGLPPRSIDSFDPQSPPFPPMRPMHLIDTRYLPDIKLDDLK
jgi:hypothetical protein